VLQTLYSPYDTEGQDDAIKPIIHSGSRLDQTALVYRICRRNNGGMQNVGEYIGWRHACTSKQRYASAPKWWNAPAPEFRLKWLKWLKWRIG